MYSKGWLFLIMCCFPFLGLTQDSEKKAVFIFTDINLVGGDPDDRQSLIHLFWYANELEIKGIVPDRWKGKGVKACNIAIGAYKKDYKKYDFKRKGYPSPQKLTSIVAKNEDQAIVNLLEAVHATKGPLYVLVWGNMLTVKKALLIHPEIASKIRLLTIGTGLKYGPKDEVPGEDCRVSNWNGPGRNEIYEDERFDQIWWVESNWTYNGMFVEPGPRKMFEKLSQFGTLGAQIKKVTKNHDWAQYFRVGDTPSVLYLIDPKHDPENPEKNSWAGTFKKPFPNKKPNYFTDFNGSIEWDYENPCNSWQNLQEMYAFNKSTLLKQREEMYASLLKKLSTLYQ